MCQKETLSTRPFDVLLHIGPRLVPFLKTVAIYFVAWLPVDYPSIFSALIKCLPILCLIAFVGCQGLSLQKQHDYQRRIFVGLIFSCIGDALLIWHKKHFVTAMASFAIAHISYIRAFGFSRPYKFLKGIPLYGLSIPLLYLIYPGLKGILIPSVFIYVWIILLMVWRAFASVDIMENMWSWTSLCGVIGAALFMISDLMIALNKFYSPIPLARVWIMTSYYAAQAFIALSAVNKDKFVIKLRLSNKKSL